MSYLQPQQRCRRPTSGRSCSTPRSQGRADGANITAQVANCPFGMLLGLTNRHPSTACELRRAKERTNSLAELVAELSKPEVRPHPRRGRHRRHR
ncbi:MAG: hypothetical protein U0W40_13195 [Acidimicrobiia bacterium]